MKLFTDVLRETRNGALVDELSEKLNELNKAVVETGKSGTITLTLGIKPAKGGAFFVSDDVKLKVPELDRESTIFFITEVYDLQRNDPRQQNLGFRSVDDVEDPTDSQEARQV